MPASEIESLCRMVDDPDPVPALLRDPDDEYLVALASEAGADAVVSGDLDLHETVGLPSRSSPPGRRSPVSTPDPERGPGRGGNF